MGSADWMPRNLDKRVEILFPVENETLKQEVIHILQVQLEDNVKAHILNKKGSYEKIDKRGEILVDSQMSVSYTHLLSQKKHFFVRCYALHSMKFVKWLRR